MRNVDSALRKSVKAWDDTGLPGRLDSLRIFDSRPEEPDGVCQPPPRGRRCWLTLCWPGGVF